MIRQTIQAQSSSAMEMLAIGTTQFERCLSNIRSTTNKLFSETEYTLLASSYDNSILGDYQTLTRASKSLQDKTYDSSVITYSYITFERNGIILDDRSAYESHSNFYPGALEYEDVSQEEWDAQNQIDVTTIKPAHVVKLMHSSYGNSYTTVYQLCEHGGPPLRRNDGADQGKRCRFNVPFAAAMAQGRAFLPDLR
mgnify:FL=1